MSMNPIVYINYKKDAMYPSHDFNPSYIYPEYPFSDNDINTEVQINDAYEMVRECLKGYGLDRKNFNTKEWNPLMEYIKPGNTVLIKPNLVMDHNENKNAGKYDLECLVTNPACIRAICDYCIIALKGIGKLIIADAPMQGCDFNALTKKMHLDDLVKFYENKGIIVELQDLRQYESIFNRNKVIVGKNEGNSKGVLVKLGKKSTHRKDGNQKYQVSDYDKEDTQHFHNGENHDYEVSASVLEADTIINFCKPKTHRLAGITASMKNLVGITYNKASLPHRTAGSVSEGGDAYNKNSWLKKKADDALTAKIRAEKVGKIAEATIYRYIYGGLLVLGRLVSKDKSYIGSWYGNDTIWRTICDLAYIVKFADKNGLICNTAQRKMLNIGDMIIAGEGNGPVSPSPKFLGILLISDECYAFDETVARIMGFDIMKIPLIKNIINNNTWIEHNDIMVWSNHKRLRGNLQNIQFPHRWKFRPHDGWGVLKK